MDTKELISKHIKKEQRTNSQLKDYEETLIAIEGQSIVGYMAKDYSELMEMIDNIYNLSHHILEVYRNAD